MSTVSRVAAVQAEPVWLDADATIDKTVQMIGEAAAGGAQLVAFPETWIPGYPVFLWAYPVYKQMEFVARYHASSIAVDGPQMQRIREAARAHSIIVVVGFSEKSGGSLYMAQVVIGAEGQILLHRRKLKPTHAERTLFGEGDGSGIKVVDTPIGRVGALNCFEHLQPLTKFAMYAQDEQIHVAGWPWLGLLAENPMLNQESILAASRTYAFEGSAYVLASTQVMSEQGALVFPEPDGSPTATYVEPGGYARIYGPDSRLLTEPLDPGAEGIVYADIDLESIALAKNVVDPAGHYSRSDVTRLVLDDRPRRPVVRPEDSGEARAESPAQPADLPDEQE